MLYAVQVRDMHTAIHNLIFYRARCAALDGLAHARETKEYPPDNPDLAGAVEIDYRAPPTEYKGERLTVVNGLYGSRPGVPNVY
jgi:hypothetical protein